MNNPVDAKELPDPDAPWRLIPIEGVKCTVHGNCPTHSIERKRTCNWHDCPYNNDGDDGYF